MAERDEAQRLLAAAQKDLRALRGMTDADTFADEIFGFHAQQAVEKALKAWLALLGEEYPRTH
jgi:HEPN domain-containing protein